MGSKKQPLFPFRGSGGEEPDVLNGSMVDKLVGLEVVG